MTTACCENAETVEPGSSVPCCVSEAPLRQPITLTVPSLGDLLKTLGILWTFDIVLGTLLLADLHTSGAHHVHRVGPQLQLLAASTAVQVWVLWHFVARKPRQPFLLGIGLAPVSLACVRRWAVIGSGWSAAALTVSSLSDASPHFFDDFFSSNSGLLALSTMFLVMPAFEEMYYRGFIFPVIKRYCGSVAACLFVIAWFTGLHGLQVEWDLTALWTVGAFSTLLTVQRAVYGSISIPLVTHVSYNATVVAFMLVTTLMGL